MLDIKQGLFKLKKITAFIFAFTLSLLLFYPNTASVSALEDIVPASNSNIRYIGRWVKSSNNMTGYWQAGFELRFTGRNIGINVVSGSSALMYSIDGGNWQKWYINAGAKTLNSSALADGEHTLKAYMSRQETQLTISGFSIDANASLLKVDKRKHIEFIGDSITEGYMGSDGSNFNLTFGFLAAESMGYDHSHIAYGGLALVPGYSNKGINNGEPGMSECYFQTKQVVQPNNSQWKMDTYAPDAIVINMGTNDGLAPNTLFQTTYISFLKKLRDTFPNTLIFAMVPFNNTHFVEIWNAVNERQSKNDFKVIFVNTFEWLTGNYTTDGIHPSIASHEIAANKLKAVMQPWLKASGQDIDASKRVMERINTIPEIITHVNKSKVTSARTMYNALSSAQKSLILNYNKLIDAEEKIADLGPDSSKASTTSTKTSISAVSPSSAGSSGLTGSTIPTTQVKSSVTEVISMINALPATVKPEDKADIISARMAYDTLTEGEKALVTNYEILTAAETRINELIATTGSISITTEATQPVHNNNSSVLIIVILIVVGLILLTALFFIINYKFKFVSFKK